MEGERGEVKVLESAEELSKALTDFVVQVSDDALRERKLFALAITGGDLPHLLRYLTRSSPYLKTVKWSRWHLFWAAENLVPKNHPDCFYKCTKEVLLKKVPIPSSQVIPVAHRATAEAVAQEYEFQIRQHVRNRRVDVCRSTDCPRFDLIVLMLEADGHLASLLPNHPILEEESLWVAPVADGGKESVTFTLPVINAAANVVIVATGSSVAQTLAAALGDPVPRGSLPAQLVKPRDGKLVWFADSSAASLLPVKDAATSET